METTMFNALRHALQKARFKRRGLLIIQAIPADTFATILDEYQARGWELTDAYRAFSAEQPRWRGVLRKGTGQLRCEWTADRTGSMVGIARIVNGVASEYNLTADASPSKG
ncbi:hypothetical protein [Alteromonas sp. CYL-A6]|uniref:hypothetical protein n=1 Tax=Alteromonas nitratireducens TaxID=3390813 RepID=UPI0034C219A3